MIAQQLQSGLIVPASATPAPPEHPVRQVIRDAMAKLADDLGNFTQTTHGVMGNGSIDSVARALVRCYEDPGAYTISDLNQFLDQFVAKSGARQ